MPSRIRIFRFTASLLGALAVGDVLEPLDSYFEQPKYADMGFRPELFSPGGVQGGSFAGSIYSLPFTTSTMVLFYRTDLIDSPPETWDEYREVAARFTQSVNPDSPTPYGTTLVGKPGQDAINLIEYSQVLWSMGRELVTTDNGIQVNHLVNMEALDFWTGLFRDGLVPPDATAFDYSSLLVAFQEEQVAMCIQWDAAAGDFADPEKSPKIYDKFDATIIPGTRQADGSIERAPYLNNWLSAINRFSNNKETTFDFFAYMYQDDTYLSLMEDHPGMSTALTGLIDSDAFAASRESSRVYNAFARSLAEGRGYAANQNLDKICSIMDNALNRALIGEITTQEAMDIAAVEIAILG